MLSWCFGNALGGLQREPAGVRPAGWRAAVVALSLLVLSACGGGGSSASAPPASPPPPAPAPAPDARLALGNAGPATVLHAVPAPPPVTSPGNPPGTEPTTLTVHYQRTAGDYDGWQIHTWNTAVDPGWNQGHNAAARTAFGVRYEVPLKGNSGEVGYLFHKGDEKDHGGRDQTYVLKPGKNEIWRIQGDDRTYTALPGSSGPPDVHTVRVHYKRFAADHADWGLHLWPASGIDTGRLPPGLVIDQWNAPVRFAQMPNFTMSGSDAVFDLPVRNPRSGGPGTVEFIIHGLPPRVDDKDGRNDNIRIDLAALNVRQQVGEVWLVQGDATVYTRVPDTRRASTTDARAVWLDGRLLRWPRVAAGGGPIKLYHSATGQITAPLDGPVAGADGAVVLEAVAAPLPAPLAERFKWVESGVTLRVPDGDAARVKTLLKGQLVLVQEDAAGRVMNATTAQLPGALDALYAAAEAVPDLGVKIAGGQTQFKLWAPTARQVLLFTYDTPDGPAVTVDEMREDPATGVFSATRSGDLTGKSYRFAVDVFVRGTGVVRNLVTDPYSVTLTANSQRSVVADLASPALKPPGWESSPVPARVASTVDMVVYELHVRDFSAHDASVSPANRGKYLAFTEPQSAGMKHLAALSQAGVTDVHLLPVFDLASVPEVGCTTPAPAGPPDGEAQQAAVAATAGRDCFNWGYDPLHFNAPEGSYATDANDGLRRIVEFRRMVMGLHAAGLRVGMDVVYNHTTASGQNATSVLDRVVPGYYHRLNADGTAANSTCCDNTATEHAMMARLMIDSAVLWAREYRIASFRFDLMGHQPRAAMERLKTAVREATGRDVQLFGEGWNFGEVANGARFRQAAQGQLDGTGIGAFGDKMRDAVRGGSGFDGGEALVANQGFINGIHVAPNALSGNVPLNELRWRGDLIRAALAGSLRDYRLRTHWDALLPLSELGGAGFAKEPDEVVNYVENHDNATLYDVNVYKLPLSTSTEERARVQNLGSALVAFSQGIAYFHAGQEILRSKSLDRNSYDAGDWFNKLDWTYTDNNFGVGLPRQSDNGNNWTVMKPLLANPALKPRPQDIAWTREAFHDLLRIRAGTTLLRLRTAADIQSRLTLLNTGPNQVSTVVGAHIDGQGYAGARFKELAYFVNVHPNEAQTVTVDALKGRPFVLHPVHRAPTAADGRARQATYLPATGAFAVPPRTAVVFVVE